MSEFDTPGVTASQSFVMPFVKPGPVTEFPSMDPQELTKWIAVVGTDHDP